jgi:hypothetical protein
MLMIPLYIYHLYIPTFKQIHCISLMLWFMSVYRGLLSLGCLKGHEVISCKVCVIWNWLSQACFSSWNERTYCLAKQSKCLLRHSKIFSPFFRQCNVANETFPPSITPPWSYPKSSLFTFSFALSFCTENWSYKCLPVLVDRQNRLAIIWRTLAAVKVSVINCLKVTIFNLSCNILQISCQN